MRCVSVSLPAVEFLKLREPLLRELNARAAVRGRLRSQLAFEAVLLVAGEVAVRGSKVGVAPHPFGREIAEKVVDRGRLSR